MRHLIIYMKKIKLTNEVFVCIPFPMMSPRKESKMF